MSTDNSAAIRKQLADAMSGHQAHIDFDSAVKDFPPQLWGATPNGAAHSAWQLLEHMRIAQHDIIEFSIDSNHKSPKWPDEYWPKDAQPPSPDAPQKTIEQFRQDLRRITALVEDTSRDLFKPFEHGDGQTLIREALLIANHNSYHLGELVFLKKQLLAAK